jgi:hypothetical protein
MKAGTAICLGAEVLQEIGLTPGGHKLFTPTKKSVFHLTRLDRDRGSTAPVVVLEPALAAKSRRFARGRNFTIVAHGRAAHAGDHGHQRY